MATVQGGTSSSLEKPGHHSKLDKVVNCDYLAFLPWGGGGGERRELPLTPVVQRAYDPIQKSSHYPEDKF